MSYLGSNLQTGDPTRTTATALDADRFSGNASTTSFTLSRRVGYPTDIEVFVENIQQEPITAYTVNGTTLTFTEAPPSGTNNVYVVYKQSTNNAQVTLADGSVTYSKLANNIRLFTSDNLTPNGNNSVFTLSEPPADANTVFVTVDGVVQRAPVHYTTSGTTITFTSAPPAGANVHVRHLGFRTSTTVTAIPVATYIPQPNIASPTISSPTITGTISGGPITVDASGNMGIGITPNTSSASAKAIEFNYGAISSYGGSEFDLSGNAYIVNNAWVYKTTAAATLLQEAGGYFSFQTAASGTAGTSCSFTERARIDNLGRLTLPYQPFFFAVKGTNQTGYNATSTGDVVVIYDTATTNTGNHYNTSTGKFTAPIAGNYIFYASAYSAATTFVQCWLVVNGSRGAYGTDWMNSAASNMAHGFWLIKLAANDTVGFHPYNSTATSATIATNPEHVHFRGYLLG